MTILVKIVTMLILIGLGFLLTHRAVPWVFVQVGRLLGFRMKMNPLTKRRVHRFRAIGRGYWSFVLITTAFVMSLFLELYVNPKPLYISYENDKGEVSRQFPALADWVSTWVPFVTVNDVATADHYGLQGDAELPYRTYAKWVKDPGAIEADAVEIETWIAKDEGRLREKLKEVAEQKGAVYDPTSPLPASNLEEHAKRREEAAFLRSLIPQFESGRATIVMALYPFSHSEQILDEYQGSPPYPGFRAGYPLFGTDFEGKDVLSQLLYGFRISFAFAMVVALLGYAIGIVLGAVMGYFGGWVDILSQRFVEIWSSIPFLYTMMIIASITHPTFLILAVMLVVLRSWLGITYYIRGEFYREKARDYVQAARAIGVSRLKIMARHIFPNALVPVVTFMPFGIVAYISSLVSLDFLGFGLPPGTPSWGSLLRQGSENVQNHAELVVYPIVAFSLTLFAVVMIGEAVREAFDPKKYSRLR